PEAGGEEIPLPTISFKIGSDDIVSFYYGLAIPSLHPFIRSSYGIRLSITLNEYQKARGSAEGYFY
ncbi:hypothetical protein COY07_02775, partial [Candidatus Peregrinibacteria bacterium CG_4_10_14_0_2_um_filter_43_11]